MASWDSYTEKTTPADNDTLMIKDTAGGANKRTPFSGVWNWIVKKLATAVISQLETTNKSIIPAINELNSKRYVQILINQDNFAANETKKIDVSKYNRGMLFVLFNAGGSKQQSNILYSFSRSTNNKTSLVEMINKNQQSSGYKIESVTLNQDTLEVTTGIYGGSMCVIYFGV